MKMFEIVNSLTESDRKTNFVAVGNLVNEKESYHSAFVIQYNKLLFEFHYTGLDIEYEPLINDYYHKVTETIHPDEVPAFIAQCKNIRKKANPDYGFFYSGESYDADGNHLSKIDLGERMTCVGFCLNVLKGFLENDYLVYTDWNSKTIKDDNYLEFYCMKYCLDPKKVNDSLRRITPRETLISCFFVDIPITKAEIDGKKADVDNFFNQIHTNRN